MTQWPAPVIRMFLGQMTPAAVLAAANDPDPIKKKDQVCDANFYSGELALRTGAKNEAARLFGSRRAIAEKPQPSGPPPTQSSRRSAWRPVKSTSTCPAPGAHSTPHQMAATC